MNKIEQLHLEAITQTEYNPEDKVPNYVGFAYKSAEITEQIAIEFGEVVAWNIVGKTITESFVRDISKQLWKEFIKNK